VALAITAAGTGSTDTVLTGWGCTAIAVTDAVGTTAAAAGAAVDTGADTTIGAGTDWAVGAALCT